jgi:hypothetical protein
MRNLTSSKREKSIGQIHPADHSALQSNQMLGGAVERGHTPMDSTIVRRAAVLRHYWFEFACLGIVILIQSCSQQVQPRKPFRILMSESNLSMAYSHEVVLTDSLIQMSFVGGLVGENPRVIWHRRMDTATSDTLIKFLETEPWSSLNQIYFNPQIMDGRQFVFEIDYRLMRDTVQLSNMWVPPLHRLAQLVNSIVPDSLRFHLELSNKVSAF